MPSCMAKVRSAEHIGSIKSEPKLQLYSAPYDGKDDQACKALLAMDQPPR